MDGVDDRTQQGVEFNDVADVSIPGIVADSLPGWLVSKVRETRQSSGSGAGSSSGDSNSPSPGSDTGSETSDDTTASDGLGSRTKVAALAVVVAVAAAILGGN